MNDFWDGLDHWIRDEKTSRLHYHSAVATNQDGDVVWDSDDPGTMYIQPVIQDYEPYSYWFGPYRFYDYPSSTFKRALLYLPDFLYCLGDTYQIKLWKDEWVFDFPRVKHHRDYRDLTTVADEKGVHYWYRKQPEAVGANA